MCDRLHRTLTVCSVPILIRAIEPISFEQELHIIITAKSIIKSILATAERSHKKAQIRSGSNSQRSHVVFSYSRVYASRASGICSYIKYDVVRKCISLTITYFIRFFFFILSQSRLCGFCSSTQTQCIRRTAKLFKRRKGQRHEINFLSDIKWTWRLGQPLKCISCFKYIREIL